MTSNILALPLACAQCGQHCKRSPGAGGTGYGIDDEGRRTCYACCGLNDRAYMTEKGRHDGLYLVKRGNRYAVVNWPSSLEFAVYHVRKSWHNFAGKDGRRDCWFNGPDGHVWHFCSIGNMDLGRARRTKETWRKVEAA